MDTNHFPVRWDNPTLLREMNLGILELNDALRKRVSGVRIVPVGTLITVCYETIPKA